MRVIWMVGLTVASFGGPDRVPAQNVGGWEDLGWMAGCWELRAGARIVHEQWMAPAGGLMLGMSRTIVRDTAREYEQLRIEVRDGRLTYVAHPFGQKETAFPLERISDTLVVFGNPAHDFPQRISYRRVGTDSLVARIEGTREGGLRGIDFPMGRTHCGRVRTGG